MSDDASGWPSVSQALSSIGQQGAADEHSGSFSFSIPLPSLPGARQVEPELSLTYSSAGGQSPFGRGAGINLLRFERQTHYGVPTYTDADTFLYNGVELIPNLQSPHEVTVFDTDYLVTDYSPRHQSSYERIQRWTRAGSDEHFWRVQDRSNRITLYGKSPSARISDPDDENRVFAWLQEQTFTARGDVILYEYLPENSDNLPPGPQRDGRILGAERYISKIYYNNRTPVPFPAQWQEALEPEDFRFILCFDYGEYLIDPAHDNLYDTNGGTWAARPDPYSGYAAGFEIRVCRLCRNILLFNRLVDLSGPPVLAHQMRLTHTLNKTSSLLRRIDLVRYAYDPTAESGERYRVAPLPPMELDYPPHSEPNTTFTAIALPGSPAPKGISAPPYSVTDLFGEGTANILYNDGETCLMWRPTFVEEESGIKQLAYDRPQAIEKRPVTGARHGAPLYLDIEGNGTLSALLMTPRPSGYYRFSAPERVEPYCTFTAIQTDSIGDSAVLADLSNNGSPDLVRLNKGLLEYAPSHGYEGYGPWRTVANEVDAPPRLWEGKSERVMFTDIAGPGSTTLTRIRQGEVEIWPGYGNGRLGPKVTLAYDPKPIATWKAGNIVFADVTGSGYSDMIYIGRNTGHLYTNQSGNGFSAPVSFTIPARIDSLGQVSFANFYGKGAAAMIVTDADNPGSVLICDFTADASPWLVNRLRNYTGLTQAIRYRGSALYAIEDAQKGEPWLTAPPFSAPVVALIETVDNVSQTRTARSFRYRDGYYDKIERMFRGYGMVSYCDTSLLYDQCHPPSAPSVPLDEPDYFTPPLLTKTWRNVGVYPLTDEWREAQSRQFWNGYADAYRMPDNHIDWGGNTVSDPETIRQAYVAQAGAVERIEIYGLDGSAQETVPYSVTESNYTIRLEEDRDGRRYASFTVQSRETVSYQFERQADDPKIVHSFALEFDEYGSQTKIGDVAYKRSSASAIDGQNETLLYAGLSSYYNHRDGDQNLLGVLTDSRQFNLLDAPPPDANGYYSFAQMERMVTEAINTPSPTGLRASLNSQQKHDYKRDEGGTGLMPQALLVQSKTAAFTGSVVNELFAPVLSQDDLDRLLNQGGYEYEDATDIWWIPGNTNLFGDADSFYLNKGHQTPFGALESRTFDDTLSYVSLGTVSAKDVVTQQVRVARFDFNHMCPTKRTDSNNRTTEEILDAQGMMVAESYYGYESGEPAGFAPIDTTTWPMPSTVAAVLENPDEYLQEASTFYYYDLFSMMGRVSIDDFAPLGGDTALLWQGLVANGYLTQEGAILAAFRSLPNYMQLQVPPSFTSHKQAIYDILDAAPHGTPIHTLRAAAWNYPGEANREPVLAMQYYDGTGRTVQTKKKVRQGPAFVIDDAGRACCSDTGQRLSMEVVDRWVTSGRTLYNQKGLEYKEYEPFFTDSYRYVDDESLNKFGVSSVTHYDALYRPIRIDSAKGFFAKQIFTPWSVTTYDRDDTVTESAFYKEHPGGKGLSPWAWSALEKAAALADTPAVTHLDNRGNTIMLSRTREDGTQVNTRYGVDAANNVIWSVDDRLGKRYPGYPPPHPNYAYVFGLNNNRLKTSGVDAGIVYALTDVAGNALFKQDALGVTSTLSVDALGRPSRLTITKPESAPQNAVTYVYGDSQLSWSPVPPNPDKHNLYGQLYTVYDQSGLITHDGFTLRAEPLGEKRQFVESYDVSINWGDDPAARVDTMLEPTVYDSASSYDALGHVIRTADADGNIVETTFDQAGIRDTLTFTPKDANAEPIITGSIYNARGQITEATFGNGLTTSWGYDPKTFETVTVCTAKGDNPPLIDFAYFYDPVGNLTHVSNNGVAGTLENHLADSDYTYDALYRLQIANGAQVNSFSKSLQRQGGYDGLTIDISGDPDSRLERFIERYAIDTAGNLYGTSHVKEVAPETGWTRQLILSEQSNRGVDGVLLNESDPPLSPWPPEEKSLPASQINPFFDADGRQVTMEGVSDLSYDYHSNLRRAVVDTGTDAEYYVIDASDKRVMKVTERTEGDDHTVEKIRYLGGLNITTVTKNDTLIATDFHVTVGSSLDLIAQTSYQSDSAQSLVYLHTASEPSVVMQTDPSGAFLTYEAYTPFGATTMVLVNGDEALSALSHKRNRYSGHERDASTGLYLYGARSLMPWLGRWPNPDPAGPVNGLNVYSFITDNPTSYIDLGGFVKVKVNGEEVEISPQEVMASWYRAATHLSKDTAGYALQSAPSVKVHSGKTLERFVLDQPDQLFRLGSLAPFGEPKQWKKSLVDISGNRLAFMPMYEKGIHLMWPMDEQNKQGKLPPYSDYSYEGTSANDIVSLMETGQIPDSLSSGSWHLGALMGGPEQQRTLIAPIYGLAGLDLIQAKRQYSETTSYTLDSFFKGKNPIFGIAGKDVAHWYKKWNKQWIESNTVGFNVKDARSGKKWGPDKNKSDKDYGRELYDRTNTVADQHADLILNREGKSYASKGDALFVYRSYLLHKAGYYTPPRPNIRRTTSLTDLDILDTSKKSRKRARPLWTDTDTEEFAQQAEQGARGMFRSSSGEPPTKRRKLVAKRTIKKIQ